MCKLRGDDRRSMSVVQPSKNRCNSEKSRMSCKPACNWIRRVENHTEDNRWRDRPSLVRSMVEFRWADQDLDRRAFLSASIPRSGMQLGRWPGRSVTLGAIYNWRHNIPWGVAISCARPTIKSRDCPSHCVLHASHVVSGSLSCARVWKGV